MADEEVTIQFEGYEDNTATYVVLTNDSEDIEEITDGVIETQQFEIQPVYKEDIDELMHTSAADPNSNDTDTQIVAAPSGEQINLAHSQFSKCLETRFQCHSINFRIQGAEAEDQSVEKENTMTEKLKNGR